MNEEMLFKQMKFIRNRTIAMLDATSEELATEIPQGFRNNLLWNFGHIVVIQEHIISGYLGNEVTLPVGYNELFNRGTSPNDWGNKEVPTLSEIKDELEKQYDRMVKICTGKIEMEGKNPIKFGEEFHFNTLGEGISFANFHEAVHQGSINGIKRALGVEDLWKAE
ncbi:DinB family protein [Oceanobacillus sp. CAU 1775]